MKQLYLTLAVIGFILPNIFVGMESFETGNVLLWLDPMATIEGMFANRISTIFIIDLLVAVVVFFIWTSQDAKKHQIKNLWLIWILTMFFGLAGAFPLYLYLREKRLDK